MHQIKTIFSAFFILAFGYSYTQYSYTYDLSHVSDSADGFIKIKPNGSGQYQYVWYDTLMNTIGTNDSIVGINQGVYLVKVTDIGVSPNEIIYEYFWIGKYGASTTLNFQPNGDFGIDAFTRYYSNPQYAYQNNSNFGNETRFHVFGSTNYGLPFLGRSLMKYKYNGLLRANVSVANLTINGAKYYNTSYTDTLTGNQITIKRVDNGQYWDEQTVSWNSGIQATGMDSAVVTKTDTGLLNVEYTKIVNITTVITPQIKGLCENNGFLLKMTNESKYVEQYFRSSDDGWIVKRPKLSITFSLPSKFNIDNYQLEHVTNSADGSIRIFPEGSGQYQYTWYDSNYNVIGNTNVIDSLNEGVYGVKVKDTGIIPNENLSTYFWVGKYGATTTLSFQPDGDFGDDALLTYYSYPSYVIYNGYNYGTNSLIGGYAGTNSGYLNIGRFLMRFQYNGLQKTAVDSVILTINGTSYRSHSSSLGNEINISRVDNEHIWEESTVSWNSFVNYTASGSVMISKTPLTAGGTSANVNYVKTTNITSLCLPHINKTSNNNGLIFKLNTESTYRTQNFVSSDHTDPTKRPKLTISFSVPLNQFYTLKKVLDGSTVHLTTPILSFKYKEEYNNSSLKYAIYNDKRQKIIDHLDIPVNVSMGEQYISINTLDFLIKKENYLLEVVTPKGEKQYLKFNVN